MKLRCRLGFHRWSPWGDEELVLMEYLNVFIWSGDTLENDRVKRYIQRRHCLDCNEAERREVKTS